MQHSFGSRPDLDDLTFSACGYQMAQVFQELPIVEEKQSDNLLEAARRWLDEAMKRPNVPDFAVWGGVCHGVLRHHAGTMATPHFMQDRDRVVAYLNGMAGIEESSLLATARLQRAPSLMGARTYYERPAVDALQKVLKLVLDPGTAMARDRTLLRALMAQGAWDLSAMLERLHESRLPLAAYAKGASGGSSETPPHELPASFGALYCLACQAVVDTSWRPKDTEVYRPLWGQLATPGVGELQRAQLIGILRAAMPRQTAAGLVNVFTKTFLTPEQIQAFFPSAWQEASLPELAENLISIYAMGRGERKERMLSEIRTGDLFECQLAQVHPELHSALCMHFVMFPDSSGWDTHAESLVEVFKTLSGAPMVAIESYALPSMDVS